MKVKAAVEGNLREVMNEEVSLAAQAVHRGVARTLGQGRKRLERRTKRAGLGNRLAKSWRYVVYPKNKAGSMGASGLLYSRAPKIIDSFTRSTVIRSTDGFFMAIPTENAPKRGTDRKRISPSNFPEGRFGPLRFVYRRNGPSLLVVDDVRVNKSGSIGRRAKGGGRTKTGRYKKGIVTVVMFVLVPQVKTRKRFDLRREQKRLRGSLPGNILKSFNELER